MYEIPTYTTEQTVGDGWIVRRGERVVAKGFGSRKVARQYIRELRTPKPILLDNYEPTDAKATMWLDSISLEPGKRYLIKIPVQGYAGTVREIEFEVTRVVPAAKET